MKLNNYQPIYLLFIKKVLKRMHPTIDLCLTCVICKIFESIIRDNIFTHFHTNNLFTTRQYGFIKGKSTVLQLLQILDDWTLKLENGGQIYTNR